MEETKNIKPISKRFFQIFGGIAICLLSIILIINVGVPARGLSFPFVYTFGIYSYLIFALVYLKGFSMIFQINGLKIKYKSVIVGLILLFICACCFTSLIWNPIAKIGTTFQEYNTYFFKFNYFTENKVLNMFSTTQPTNYAGGFLGTIICQPLVAASPVLAYVIVSLLLLTALLITFFPVTMKVFKNRKAKEKPEKEDKNAVLQQSPFIVYDPIKNANSVDFIEKAEKTPTAEFVRVDQNIEDEEKEKAFSQFQGAGLFKKPHFDLHPVAEEPKTDVYNKYLDEPSPLKPVYEQEVEEEEEVFVEEEPVEENIPDPIPTPVPTPVQPTPRPQPVARPVAQPTVVTEQPKEEKPKVKKPIKWIAPSSDLLITGESSSALKENIEIAEKRKQELDEIFRSYNVRAEVNDYIIGPSVTRFNIKYEANVQSKSVYNIVEDISRRLGGVPARFEAVIEGSYYSGLEVPNARSSTVSFKELFNDLPDAKKVPMAVAFGKNIEGKTVWADFRKFPHILVAGTTGSGKSIFIHSLIATLIMRSSPDDLRIALIDPKKVEMVRYKEMPHLLCPIINEPSQALSFMKKLVDEMNDRYSKLEMADGATSLDEYNDYAKEHGLEKIPYIVVIVDEYGDLVESCKEISQPILLIGQKARACGIHMLISTQSPTTNIITGTIKNNLPTHVALSTANSMQSQTILGVGGAEKLLGNGDMLVQSNLVSKVGLARLQGCFAQKKEICYVVGFLKEHYPLQYNETFLNLEEEAQQEGKAFVAGGGLEGAMDAAEEAKFQSIKEWVMSNQYMSMSRIQGECAVGFNRARRFFNRLQNEGVVAKESEGNRGCPVLMHDDYDDSVPSSDELTSF